MGRGTAIYKALVKGSKGKLEPIKATEVTKEMKDRSEIFIVQLLIVRLS